MARRRTPTRIQQAEEADIAYEAQLAESARVQQAIAAEKAKAEEDAYYTRDPKTGLSPAQVEANKAVQAAAQGATELGLPAVVVKGDAGESDRVSTPPTEGLKPGYEWYASPRAGGGIEWRQRPTRDTLVNAYTTLFSGSDKGDGDGGNGFTGSFTGGPTITQADIDNAVNKALAAQAAQFKAQQDAEKMLTRTRAKDKLTAMLAGWNLTGLADWLDKQIMADVSEEMIFLGLYDQPEYQKRFPGMDALRKAGRTITEGEYIKIENQMMQTARFFDLPVGFYDGPEDFGNLIGKQVSAKEYQDRLQIGQDLARTLNAEVKQQLIDFYGVGEGDLTAYVLDADRALPLIQKQAKAAQFVGLGRAAGFSLQGITSQQAEAIAGTEPYAKLSEAQLKQSLGQAGYLRRTQQRLSQIEGMTYNEQEALNAVIESSPEALLASQQRAQREVARFSARGGVTAGSLKDITAI